MSEAPAPTGAHNTTVTTPSGMVIEYESAPKRLYRVDGVEVPSVTTILDCLDKKGLPWWGMKIGVEGVQELASRGLLQYDITAYPVDGLVALLNSNQLTVNHQRDKAGSRGVNVHDALERWAQNGSMPDPSDYPSDEMAYVVGLLAFFHDVGAHEGNFEPEGFELMVGSKEHGYAGRFDLRARLHEPRKVVVKVYPKKPSKVTTIPAGVGIQDLKTGASVYETHPIQLEAYEGASVESGYDATDYRFVIHVTKDGRYEVRQSKVSISHFLAIKGAWHAIEEAKEAIKV